MPLRKGINFLGEISATPIVGCWALVSNVDPLVLSCAVWTNEPNHLFMREKETLQKSDQTLFSRNRKPRGVGKCVRQARRKKQYNDFLD